MIYFGVIDLSSVEIYFQCKITSSVLPQQQLGHPVVFTHLFLPPPELLLQLLLLGGGAPDQSELSIVHKDNRIGHEILTLIFSFNYV